VSEPKGRTRLWKGGFISTYSGARGGGPMPLGFHFRLECKNFVPEGHTILAQRFNVGSGHRLGASPEGTTEPGRTASAVPSGLLDVSNAKPNAEALGYFQKSLRDESEILVTLTGTPRGPVTDGVATRLKGRRVAEAIA